MKAALDRARRHGGPEYLTALSRFGLALVKCMPEMDTGAGWWSGRGAGWGAGWGSGSGDGRGAGWGAGCNDPDQPDEFYQGRKP